MISRRQVLARGGSLAALLLPVFPFRAYSADPGEGVEIVMRSRGQGAHVWFDPIGLLIEPGQRLTWRNGDPVNSHTVTAYHPDIDGRPRRWPQKAKPFDSGYLLPDETFSVILTEPGIYDYYCMPHEYAGMVGRIIVAGATEPEPLEQGDIPEAALAALPAIEDILEKGKVER